MRVEIRNRKGDLVGHNVRLTEYEPLRIQVFSVGAPKRTPDVILDGASIGAARVTMEGAELCWEWIYRSESWCGRSHLTVTSDGSPTEILIQTIPDGRKYSEDEYDRMIARLLAYRSDLLFGLAPGRSNVQEGSTPSPRIALPTLLDHYLDPLLQQLDNIVEAPVLATFQEDVLRPCDLSRPTRPHILRWLAVRPEQATQLRRGDVRTLLPQQRRIETYDHPANRYVKAIINRLVASFERTAIELEKFAKGALVDVPEAARCSHLSQRLRRAVETMTSVLQCPLLERLQAGSMTEGVAQVFAGQPHYARFARMARRLLTNGIELNSTALLQASLRRSWDVFELYCLHRLVEVLEDALASEWIFERTEYQVSLLCAPASGLFWKATHQSGMRWELLFQQPFRRGAETSMSITTGRQPDFVLCQYRGETLEGWILLDAKYRSNEQSLNDALASMHVYRDSLRWNSSDKAVNARAGYLLVPTISEHVTRYADGDFLTQWGIGLIDIEDESLGKRLINAMNGASTPLAGLVST